MLRDIATVTRKELLEMADQLLRLRRGGWSMLVVVAVLGVASPLQLGTQWLDSPMMFLYWPLLVSSTTSSLVADAIAGERERHTLETLLATRIGDGAILAGKLLAAVSYGMGFVVVNLAIGWGVVCARFGGGTLLPMPPGRLPALLALVASSAWLMAALGVLVSIRAATVRQAQQVFGVLLVVLLMTPVGIVQLASPLLRTRVLLWLARTGADGAALRGAGALALAALALTGLAVARFRRGRIAFD